jgi:hypothetical protein
MTESDVREDESVIENMEYELRREALAHAVDRANKNGGQRSIKGLEPATAGQIVAEAKTFHEFLKSQ